MCNQSLVQSTSLTTGSTLGVYIHTAILGSRSSAIYLPSLAKGRASSAVMLLIELLCTLLRHFRPVSTSIDLRLRVEAHAQQGKWPDDRQRRRRTEQKPKISTGSGSGFWGKQFARSVGRSVAWERKFWYPANNYAAIQLKQRANWRLCSELGKWLGHSVITDLII